jgi:hypothetical protein
MVEPKADVVRSQTRLEKPESSGCQRRTTSFHVLVWTGVENSRLQ